MKAIYLFTVVPLDLPKDKRGGAAESVSEKIAVYSAALCPLSRAEPIVFLPVVALEKTPLTGL